MNYLITFAKIRDMNQLFGRQEDISELRRDYESGKTEFIAAYGRRRIWEDFLIIALFRLSRVF